MTNLFCVFFTQEILRDARWQILWAAEYDLSLAWLQAELDTWRQLLCL